MGSNGHGFEARRRLKGSLVAKYGEIDFYYNGSETIVSKYNGSYLETIGFIVKADAPVFCEFRPVLALE